MTGSRFWTLIVLALALGCGATHPPASVTYEGAVPDVAFEWDRSARPSSIPGSYSNVQNLLETRDPILALYREDLTHRAVTEFFVTLAGREEIALPILYHADAVGISPSLVFAIAWAESRFLPEAVNRNATSIDRGVFQLNSRTFTDLSEDDFFHPDINSYHGVRYLEWCLDHTTSVDDAVAAYNGGLSRVRAGTIPASTQRYVIRVREYREQIEAEFRLFIAETFPGGSRS